MSKKYSATFIPAATDNSLAYIVLNQKTGLFTSSTVNVDIDLNEKKAVKDMQDHKKALQKSQEHGLDVSLCVKTLAYEKLYKTAAIEQAIRESNAVICRSVSFEERFGIKAALGQLNL